MQPLPSRPGLIVDIDETLFDTVPRKAAILRDLFGLEITPEEIRADFYLTNYLRSQDQVKDFFREFHSGKYLHLDVPIDDAPQILQRLAAKVTIVYLTGRHAKGVQPWMAQQSATLQSLQRFGFPFPDDQNTFLVMKPFFAGFESPEKQAAEDLDYKIKAVSQLVARHRVVAGVGDSFSDLFAYNKYGISPICLKRPHFSYFADRFGELTSQPFVAAGWLAVEKQVLEILKGTQV